jgi:hypothetical protein
MPNTNVLDVEVHYITLYRFHWFGRYLYQTAIMNNYITI